MNKKRAKSKRARKSGTRRTGRGRRRAVAKFRGLRLAARRPSRKPRRHAGRRRTLKRAIGRVSRRKTRRAAPKRRARKHGLKMNRRRRHFRSNAIFASIQNLFMQALPVVGGLLAHKVLTGLVVSNLMKNSTMKGKESLVGLAVAIGGFMAMDKFAPAHSLKFGMGMVASEVHTVIKELVPGMSQYGLGASQSLMPRYTLGEYYQPTAGYYEAAAGNPYFQAAAGAYTEAAVGEYYRGDAAQLPRAAAGEYYTSGLTVQGTSDYEITNNVSGVGASPMYEGVVPDSNLDRELDFIEAAAGVGAPNRAAPGARSIYQPAENALTVGSSNSVPQGVFEAPGGSGILS